MKILGKLLSYYYMSAETGWLEAIRLFFQIEIMRTPIVNYYRKGLKIHIHRDDTTVWAIQYSVKKIEKLVNEIPIDDPAVVFDVGANCGLFTLFVKSRFPNAKVYAFEPSPVLCEVIRKNIGHLNDIEIIECAITDKDGAVVPLFIDMESQENNTLDISQLSGRKSVTQIDVPTKRLDSFVEERGIQQIDVLKVDIQGSEGALLRGGTTSLQKTQVAFFEVWLRAPDVFETVDVIRKFLPEFKALNPIIYGADMCFYRAGEVAKSGVNAMAHPKI